MTAMHPITDAPTFPMLMRRMSPPSEAEVATAIVQAVKDVAKEFSKEPGSAARLALRAACALADPGDRKLLDLLIRSEKPRHGCAIGHEASAWDVRDLAAELREIADMWADEAERVIGSD